MRSLIFVTGPGNTGGTYKIGVGVNDTDEPQALSRTTITNPTRTCKDIIFDFLININSYIVLKQQQKLSLNLSLTCHDQRWGKVIW